MADKTVPLPFPSSLRSNSEEPSTHRLALPPRELQAPVEPGNWPSIILISWLWRPQVPGLDGPRGPGGARELRASITRKQLSPGETSKCLELKFMRRSGCLRGQRGCSLCRYLSSTYRVPGAESGGLEDLLSSWWSVAEPASLGEA